MFEVAFEGLQRSTRHKSGLAMRFPRISRLRWDKPPREADRLETLERMLARIETGRGRHRRRRSQRTGRTGRSTNRSSLTSRHGDFHGRQRLTRFLGGPPLAVLVKLVLLSILIGVVLSALGLDPWNIVTAFAA